MVKNYNCQLLSYRNVASRSLVLAVIFVRLYFIAFCAIVSYTMLTGFFECYCSQQSYDPSNQLRILC